MAGEDKKYTPFIPDITPHVDLCSRIGKVPGDSVIPTGEDICWSYKFVDTLPDLTTSPQKICIAGKKIGAFQAGQVLIAKTDSSSTKWVSLPNPTKGVGVPTQITCVYSASRDEVYLRWKDPEDVDNYVWKKTRILKKAGGYPANENDGIVVVDSTVRDQYNDLPIIDPSAKVITADWHYRAFAYSEDGVVSTDDTCKAKPMIPDWGPEMSSQIQAGYAPMIFHVGDEITLQKRNGGVTTAMTFVVAGFDLVTPVDTGKKRSVALISKSPVATLQYDKEHPSYALVIDEIAPIKGTKTYYKKYYGNTYKVYPVETDTYITADMEIYVRETDRDAVAYGCNIWKTSTSRAYLNDATDGWLSKIVKPSTGIDPAFGSMILDVNSPYLLEGISDKVRLPTVDQIEQWWDLVSVTGWTSTRYDNTTYTVYWYDQYRELQYGYANASKASHVVIHIG